MSIMSNNEENIKPEQVPMGKDADKFDANQNERVMRHMPDGRMIMLSNQEFADEMAAYNEERRAA